MINELKFLKDRLEFRHKLFMEYAFADNRLIKEVKKFGEDTREIEERIDELKKGTKETSGEFLARLGTNGDLWAKEFIKIINEKKFIIDVDLMRGWFCNAIEAGRNAK